MRKFTKDFKNIDYRHEFIKINDRIDACTMQAITGVDPDEAEGRNVIQNSHASNDVLGDMRLYETVLKLDGGPYIYKGLCEKDVLLNRHPASALPVFICSPYKDACEYNLTTKFNERFAMAVARKIFEKGNLPVAPHLYFPRFLTDRGYEREYGIEAGHLMMRSCEEIVVFVIDGYISPGMASDIEYATEQLALQPVYERITFNEAAELIAEMESKEEE